MIDVIRHPRTVVELAKEIMKVADAYWGREIKESELREIIVFWATHENRKLFAGSNLNSSITKIIGKRRVELVNAMLEGIQLKFE